MNGSFGVQLQKTLPFSFGRIDVRIFEVDAANGVNETFAVDARAIGSRQHVSRKSDGLAVFSLSR